MRLKSFIFALLLVVAGLPAVANVQDLILSKKGVEHASVGVSIVDVDTRKTIVSYEADEALVPASVVKVITAATVMKIYDNNKRWETVVGYNGTVANGVLHGDIIVKGNLDPSLAHPRGGQRASTFIDGIVSGVQAAGIRTVEGDIIVDASICEEGGQGEWLFEDIGFYYGAACHGVNYKANKFLLYMHTGEQGERPAISSTSTPMKDLYYHNYLTVGKKDSAMVWIAPYASDVILTGIVPAVKDSFSLNCAMPDPPLKLADDIYDALMLGNVDVLGTSMTNRVLEDCGLSMPTMTTVLYRHKSDRLYSMLRTMMFHSDNLYAEALLRYVGLSVAPVARLATSLQVERDLWQREGLPVKEMKVHDGSGLSRKNVVTPNFLSRLLVKAYNDSDLADDYVKLFPQVGKDGTARNFMKKQPLPGVLRLKSGTMGGVLCYAGYYTVNDKTYAVTIMSNNHSCKAKVVRTAFEEYLYEVLSNL